MNFDRSGGPDLLPCEIDPAALGEARADFEREAETLPRDLRRVLFWSLRLMQQREAIGGGRVGLAPLLRALSRLRFPPSATMS